MKERCIVFTQRTRCGACHYACPVRPERAISVSGLAVHGIADKPPKDLFGSPASGEGGPAPPPGAEGFPF